MHQVPWERPQGQDLEPSSRAPSQARIYLEQIQKRVTLIGQDRVSSGKIQTGKRDYLVDAAKQIRQALDKEVNEDYEAAFNFYKNGVDLLLKGIQVDSNGERREAVKRKITQYLKRAEDIFNCHLQKGIGSSACQSEGFSSFRFRPIRILSSPVEYLKSCKVVGVIDKVLLAQDPSLGETFIVKSLCKSNVETRNQQTIIPQGVPYMVRLLRYYVSEDAIFLHLEYVPGGKLWPLLRKCHSLRVKDYPECSSFHCRNTQLKTSYTSPSLQLLGEEQEKSHGCRNETSIANSNFPACTHSSHSVDQVYRTAADQIKPHNSSSNQSFSQDNVTCPSGSECSTFCSDTSTSFVTSLDGIVCGDKGYCHTLAVSANEGLRQDSHLRTGCTSAPENKRSLSSHVFLSASKCSDVFKQQPSLWDHGNQDGSVGPSKMLMEHNRCEKSLDMVTAPIGYNNLRDDYEITVNPLEAMHNIQTRKDFGKSDLILSSGSCSMARNTTDSASGIEQSDLRTPAVSDLSHTGQPCCITHLQPTYQAQSKLNTGAGGPHSSLHKETSVVVQSKNKNHCPDNGDSLISSNSDKVLGSPEDNMHIEVDGWCMVSSSRPQKNEKGRLVPGGFTEDQICYWAAEMVLALESLHQQGIICRDLNPRNILLDSTGHVCLTYFGQWGDIEPHCSSRAVEDLFCAPELSGICEVTEACDWWSLGAILYELLTGVPLSHSYPSGINSSTPLRIPDNLSMAATSLLTELLQYDATYRLGTGVDGANEIKAHPFFSSVQWGNLTT
ncbi:ribosomal protein S6 kinase-like 1 [Protopterus annectens]|uniref:ribosomal protein S6 kinase-like 1 n=1 Tax=Protopterus annectens TaxID=7888 RepID=UPI001CFB16D8|nr:ribosomal protein S6 kinase-like 1 [Protopterus annectens]XP_043919967.1 ribosomal protein S6 kinase-like 1 [Protopterus annectens]